jgi:hypothetical protein
LCPEQKGNRDIQEIIPAIYRRSVYFLAVKY